MGDIIKGYCNCGYQSDDLFLGVGMNGGTGKTVCYCTHCKKIQTEPSYNIPKLCQDCGKQIVPYTSGEDDVKFSEFEEDDNEIKKYHCPKCNKEELKFISTGIWD